MKRFALILIAAIVLPYSVLAQHQTDSLTFANADWHWQKLSKGAVAGYAQMNIFGGIQNVSVIRYPARRYETSVEMRVGKMALPTSALAEELDALLAVNGSYFNMKELTNMTFCAIDGNIVSETDDSEKFRCNGAVMTDGHKVVIDFCDSLQLIDAAGKYASVLSSGPIVLKDGIRPYYENPDKVIFLDRHPRTVMGLDGKGNVYMAVIDGRSPGQADGTSIAETGLIARWLGMETAINLDGGGSSEIWSSTTGTINHPSDNKKWDHKGSRTVPNIIIAW